MIRSALEDKLRLIKQLKAKIQHKCDKFKNKPKVKPKSNQSYAKFNLDLKKKLLNHLLKNFKTLINLQEFMV